METPLALGLCLKQNTGPTISSMMINGKCVMYTSVVGLLMYAILGMYLDLAYTVGLLGQYSSNPGAAHWATAKHALWYLQCKKDQVLTYQGKSLDSPLTFFGYSDADWGGDNNTSRLTLGYVFMACGSAIGWSSKRQSLVAMLSIESEYIGLANAGIHLSWLQMFFEDVGHAQEKPTTLFCDNQSAISVSKDLQYHSCTKLIQWKYHYIWDDVVGKKLAIIQYILTVDMVVDIFTKALSWDKHSKFATVMGLQPCSSGSVRI